MQRFAWSSSAWSSSTDDKEVSNSLFKVLSLSKCVLLLWLCTHLYTFVHIYTHFYTFAGKQHSTSLIDYKYNKQYMTTVMETIWFHLTLGYRPIVVFAKWLERLKCISLCPCKCVARTAFFTLQRLFLDVFVEVGRNVSITFRDFAHAMLAEHLKSCTCDFTLF